MSELKKYSIPITWESYKRYEVEAENIKDAIKKALKIFLAGPDDLYLEDSFDIFTEVLEEEYPDEDFDLTEIYQEL